MFGKVDISLFFFFSQVVFWMRSAFFYTWFWFCVLFFSHLHPLSHFLPSAVFSPTSSPSHCPVILMTYFLFCLFLFFAFFLIKSIVITTCMPAFGSSTYLLWRIKFLILFRWGKYLNWQSKFSLKKMGCHWHIVVFAYIRLKLLAYSPHHLG